MTKQTISIELPLEQFSFLVERLGWVDDCGPDGGGWKSPELERLIAFLQDALDRAKPEGSSEVKEDGGRATD